MFGNGYNVSRENNGMFGKPRTDEVIAKISKKVSGENNPHYGKPVKRHLSTASEWSIL